MVQAYILIVAIGIILVISIVVGRVQERRLRKEQQEIQNVENRR